MPARKGGAASELPRNNQAMKSLLTLAILVTSLTLSRPMFAASFKVRAQIDAHSQLIVRRDGLFWHHLLYARPGLHDCGCPTLINGYPWTPIWPNDIAEIGPTDAPIDSATLDVSAAFSANGVAITEVSGRGRVTVVQQPTTANDFTLIVDFDDIKEGGAAFYEVTISGVSITALPRLHVKVGSVSLSFQTETNRLYQIQYTDQLSPTQWIDLGVPLKGYGTNIVVADTVLDSPRRVYRVNPLPNNVP